MLAVNVDQNTQIADRLNPFLSYPITVEVGGDPKVVELLADLSPETPWGERKMAAKRLGYLRNREAVPGLVAALRTDEFWMVRCAIIQALEMIGDPEAVPALEEVEISDGFQAVRSYAGKALHRLSQIIN